MPWQQFVDGDATFGKIIVALGVAKPDGIYILSQPDNDDVSIIVYVIVPEGLKYFVVTERGWCQCSEDVANDAEYKDGKLVAGATFRYSPIEPEYQLTIADRDMIIDAIKRQYGI